MHSFCHMTTYALWPFMTLWPFMISWNYLLAMLVFYLLLDYVKTGNNTSNPCYSVSESFFHQFLSSPCFVSLYLTVFFFIKLHYNNVLPSLSPLLEQIGFRIKRLDLTLLLFSVTCPVMATLFQGSMLVKRMNIHDSPSRGPAGLQF